MLEGLLDYPVQRVAGSGKPSGTRNLGMICLGPLANEDACFLASWSEDGQCCLLFGFLVGRRTVLPILNWPGGGASL